MIQLTREPSVQGNSLVDSPADRSSEILQEIPLDDSSIKLG